MMIDTNIMVALLDHDEDGEFLDRMGQVWADHQPCVNEIIFAEIARDFDDTAQAEELLGDLGISISRLTLAECHRAGQAFAEYRRRGGQRTTILPDFLIGAQAATRGWPLVTRDRKGFASYFPELTVIDPLEDIA
jgi:predicted nucleic acid-binding protein